MRPQYSSAGMLRACQMAEENVAIFIEGIHSDPFFFCSILKETRLSSRYTIRRANELEDENGGKKKTKSFFGFLLNKNSLITELDGKKTAIFFFLDKDIDDLAKNLIKHPHVIYSRHYNIENDIAINSNIIKAVGCACSLEEKKIPASLKSNTWHIDAHTALKNWVLICLLIQLYNIPGHASYSSFSRIHDRSLTELPNSLEAALDTLKKNSGMNDIQFDSAIRRIIRIRDRLLGRGKGDHIFNGKWYFNYLEALIEKALSGTPFDKNSLPDRLRSSCMATLNFRKPWSLPYRRKINTLVTQYGI